MNESFMSKDLTDKESTKLMKRLKLLFKIDKEGAQKQLDRLNVVRKADGLRPLSKDDLFRFDVKKELALQDKIQQNLGLKKKEEKKNPTNDDVVKQSLKDNAKLQDTEEDKEYVKFLSKRMNDFSVGDLIELSNGRTFEIDKVDKVNHMLTLNDGAGTTMNKHIGSLKLRKLIKKPIAPKGLNLKE